MAAKTTHNFSRLRHADIATAKAADVISISTPVAYAPPCDVTSASKRTVTPKQIADNAAAIAVMAYVVADLPWRLGTEK